MHIEKSVPLPPVINGVTHGQYIELTKIMKSMNIDDSFLMPVNCRAGCRSVADRAKIKITVRKQPDGQIRVWRIA